MLSRAQSVDAPDGIWDQEYKAWTTEGAVYRKTGFERANLKDSIAAYTAAEKIALANDDLEESLAARIEMAHTYALGRNVELAFATIDAVLDDSGTDPRLRDQFLDALVERVKCISVLHGAGDGIREYELLIATEDIGEFRFEYVQGEFAVSEKSWLRRSLSTRLSATTSRDLRNR
ncbi:MAG: hypothetical protein H7311_06045 [Ramlibacter sp.]|nr:hypothetical protein [Cryobacterium sp.]